MKHPIGTRVTVTSATDETTDLRFIGKIGTVTRYNTNGETGNTEEDPLHVVEFDTQQFERGQPIPQQVCEGDTDFDEKLNNPTITEEFWFEELTAQTSEA